MTVYLLHSPSLLSFLFSSLLYLFIYFQLSFLLNPFTPFPFFFFLAFLLYPFSFLISFLPPLLSVPKEAPWWREGEAGSGWELSPQEDTQDGGCARPQRVPHAHLWKVRIFFEVTVSRDGFGFWWHVWLVLGLNRVRAQFFLCSNDFITQKVCDSCC
jgi:hypothetical protein